MRIQYGFSISLALLVGWLTGCTTNPLADNSRLSALQIRSIQTRSYDEADARAVLKTVLNVLQDEGYIVDFGNMELGLLHGSKMVDRVSLQQAAVRNGGGFGPGRPGGPNFPGANGGPFGFPQSSTPGAGVNVVTIEATANVTGLGKQTRVRISFGQKLATGAQVVLANPVVDPELYQEFFAKLERGLFLQQQGL